MNNDSPPDGSRLFLVPRSTLPPTQQPGRPRPRQSDAPLIALALLFLAVVAFAGYACLFGSWERARDFLLIFLPALAALMGAACTIRRLS